MGQTALKAKVEVEQPTPVQRVEHVFGRKRAAQLVDLTTDALKKWGRPVSKGGQGGLVPARYQSVYLTQARREGLALEPWHFIAEPVR
jgi:hypothetical protein